MFTYVLTKLIINMLVLDVLRVVGLSVEDNCIYMYNYYQWHNLNQISEDAKKKFLSFSYL